MVDISNATEVTSQRTLYTKTYKMADENRFIIRGSLVPLHLQDISGGFEDINPGWTQVAADRWQSTGVSQQVEILASGKSLSWSYVGIDQGVVDGALTRIDNRELNRFRDLDLSTPIIEGRQISWRGILPEYDLYALLSQQRLSWSQILHGQNAPRSMTWDVSEDELSATTFMNSPRGRDNFDQKTIVARLDVDQRRKIEVSPHLSAIDRSEPGKLKYQMMAEWTGRVIQVDPETRIRSFSADFAYPVWIDPTVTEPIPSDANDGNEMVTAATWNSKLLDDYLRAGRNSVDIANGGFRFTTIQVPQGATIANATLTYEVSARFAPFSLNIYGDNVDSAPSWSNSSRPSQVSKTTASTSLVAPATGIQSTTITSIIQEIINRAGWASGNDMRFGIMSEGAFPSGYHYLHLVDASTWGSQNFAELFIDYTVGGDVSSDVWISRQRATHASLIGR